MDSINYGKQMILEEDIDAVINVLKSDFLTQGPEIGKFENEVASFHNAKYAVAFSNGTAALHGAYSALGVENGDEIITSPITFVATANGAVYCGAIPKFVDMDPTTNCMDYRLLEGAITDKTKVISPIAYAGYPVDLKSISTIAKQKNIKVLYDAAHAIGSKRDGTFGMEYIDAAILSFHPVKHIAAGEGGMVLTNDEIVYKRLLAFRSHGTTKDPDILEKNDGPWYYEMHSLGYNYRITDFQCALANSQFARIEDNLKRRNEIANLYDDSFADLSFIETPPNVGFEIIDRDRWEDVDNLHSYHLYTLHLKSAEERRSFYDYLHSKGVMAQIHYVPVHLHPYYKKNFGYKEGDYPNAEAFYAGEISIPMYHGLKDDQLEYIIKTVREYK